MVQKFMDKFWQAEARSEETKLFILDIKRQTRCKFTVEEKIRIVLECFCRDTLLETFAAGKAYIQVPIMPS